MYRIVENGRKPPEQIPDCHRMQYIDFFAYLGGDDEYSLTGVEGLKTVQIIDAVYRSSRTKAPVTFGDPEALIWGEELPRSVA